MEPALFCFARCAAVGKATQVRSAREPQTAVRATRFVWLSKFRVQTSRTRRTGARRRMVEKAKDIVERLRKEATGVTVNLNPWPTMREAAEEIALCRARVTELEDGRLRALLAATVGNLTVIGYQNALAQVRAALSGTYGNVDISQLFMSTRPSSL